MDNWEDNSGFGENELNSTAPGDKAGTSDKGIERGGWHWMMTLVCIVTVTFLSFLMAQLTKDTLNRPFWMIGAIFTVPTLGMFLAALLVERKTSLMTPVTSRKAQYLVALIAVISTFAVGCVCALIYQQGTLEQVIKNWAMTHPPETVYSDIVLMVDKSSSLGGGGKDAANRKAIKEWLTSMDDRARVGLVVFSGDVITEISIDALAKNRERCGAAGWRIHRF